MKISFMSHLIYVIYIHKEMCMHLEKQRKLYTKISNGDPEWAKQLGKFSDKD